MAKVELKNICKTYDNNVKIIENINLEIKDTEFLVLVGPSGCGKSTILRMIAGLEDITSGDLLIGDKIVNDVHPKDRDIAMVFQNYALYPHMNVYDNMAFGLKMRKFKKDIIEQRVKDAAEILGLTDLLDRKPKQLSGGQRQRVALGRAIVRNPQVFLMDEPLSNLDAKLRVQMRTEIKKLHQRLSTTFVYVTHDQVEALTMGDRIVVLFKGVIQQFDTPEMIYNFPENMFVASFIGSPSMNFIDCNIIDENIIDINGQQIFTESNLNELIKENNLQGKTAICGIRPEHFGTENIQQGNCLKIEPDLIEMLGSEKLVYFKINDRKHCAKLSSDFEVKQNLEICLSINIDKILLFDKETEKRYKVENK
jgi:multiple sugar transport system ATP-binding protein